MTPAVRRFLAAGVAIVCASPVSYAQDALVDHSQTDQTTKIEAHLEKKYTVKLELTPPESRRCQARLLIDYLQKNAVASVESTLENDDCAASSGRYTVSVRFKDENNELRNVDYEETWQREDDQPIITAKDYFAGENVDIIRVRAKSLRCTCAETLPRNEE